MFSSDGVVDSNFQYLNTFGELLFTFILLRPFEINLA